MDYETIIEEQLNSMDLSELEGIMTDAAGQSGLFDDLTVICIINDLINGNALFDSEMRIDNLMDLFLMEVKACLLYTSI